MLYVFLKHLRALLADLEALERENINWPTGSIGEFSSILLITFREVVQALDRYFVTQNNVQLHRDCITAGLDLIVRWEIFLINFIFDTGHSRTARVFHEQLLRWFKGAMKAWRVYLVDSTK